MIDWDRLTRACEKDEKGTQNKHKEDNCPEAECLVCSRRDCPNGEPLHYHHDGCPACDSWDEED